MSTKNKTAPAARPAAAPGGAAGAVDIDAIVAHARAGIPPQLQAIFDKAVLSGMRIMFDKSSHAMMLAELAKPGPMAKRISDGIIALMYMLWKQSNHTLPPQIIVPVTLTLTLRAFQFLQQSQDPEATPAVLGDATAEAVQGVMDRFGATQDKIPHLLNGLMKGGQPGAAPAGGQAVAPAAPAQGGGMLDQVGG